MSQTLQGVFWMLGTIVSFSVMAVSGRELASELDTFEVMAYRSMIGVTIMLCVIAATRTWSDLRTDRIGLHATRNIAHFTGQNLWFFAVGAIPLAQVFALEFTTPIWVIILSPLFLGERLTWIRGLCAVLGFAGVLLVARSDMVEISWGVSAAAASAIFFALSVVFTKQLTATETITRILFYLTTMQLAMGLAAAGYDGDMALPSSGKVIYVILVGIGGLAAHFCYTKALTLAPATIVSPVDFGRLPTIALVAWLLYDEPVQAVVIIGALIIFGGNYLNIWVETRKTKPAT